MLSPSFWPSRHWLRLQPFRIRLLFLGIFSNADDEGRIIGLAASIKSVVFPHDSVREAQVEEDLEALAREGLIKRYRYEDVPYIQVTKWDDYQTINHPQKSHIPALEQGDLFIAVNSDSDNNSEIVDVEPVNNSGNSSGNDSRNDSGIDSGNETNSGSSLKKSSKDKSKENSANLPKGAYRTFKKQIMKDPQLGAFNTFWNAFDYKHDKARAADAWLDIDWPDSSADKNDLFKLIIKKAKKAASNRVYDERANKTSAYAEKWINRRRWEDD